MRRACVVCALVLAAACAKTVPPVAAPAVPQYPAFEFPAPVAGVPPVSASILERHQQAWNLLQAGQSRAAARAYADIVSRAPAFYPAKTGLAYTALADRDYKAAVSAFEAALAQAPGYLPALAGRADALLAADRPAEAIGALEALLKVDPSRTAARTRLETLRLGTIDALVEEGRQARQRGDWERARDAWTRALQAAPESAFMYRELGSAERQLGRLDEAKTHVEAALRLDDRDAAAQALLGEIEAARGSLPEAVAAFRRAQELDTRLDYRMRIADLERRMAYAAMPEPYRAIAGSPQANRGDVAALLGVALEGWLAEAGGGTGTVVTDVRSHWAQRWILAVTAARLMEVYPNHTFQPAAVVHRNDLAEIVQQTLVLAAARHPERASDWRRAPASFSDLPETHVSYAAASLAVSAGVMQADEDRAFAPRRAVTGAEATAVVDRLAALVLRR